MDDMDLLVGELLTVEVEDYGFGGDRLIGQRMIANTCRKYIRDLSL